MKEGETENCENFGGKLRVCNSLSDFFVAVHSDTAGDDTKHWCDDTKL
jgi:hypothetical protein